MLQSLDIIKGMPIAATDGVIGAVDDLYFDDDAWTVRYLVVDSGTWLPGRRVLLAVEALGDPAGDGQIPARLTREQVRSSPDIDTARPVHRQQEEALFGYYGWQPYWAAAGLAGGALTAGFSGDSSRFTEARRIDRTAPDGDAHLRSGTDVQGYAACLGDGGHAGRVSDMLFDAEDWQVRYLAIDTDASISGRTVLLAPVWVDRIDWAERRVNCVLTRDQIRESPDYDEVAGPNRGYEGRLHSRPIGMP